ncbi:MAG: efflux RND transporter permease subunit, partial [Nitriliruptoraceae bacterium]
MEEVRRPWGSDIPFLVPRLEDGVRRLLGLAPLSAAAAALAGAVAISGIVALTISPMMAARVLRPGGENRFQQALGRGFLRLEGWYERRLSSSLNFTPVTVLLVAVLA